MSGSGTITVPFINSQLAKVKVVFTELQLNENDEVIGGSARALIADNASFLPQPSIPEVNTIPLTLSDATSLDQYFTNNKSQLLSQIEQIANETGSCYPWELIMILVTMLWPLQACIGHLKMPPLMLQ